jgi:F420-dependent oxidoreductase-like protein
MKISTAVNYAGDVVKAADTVARLEAAGIDTVWVAEAYSFDAISLMGYLAAKTSTVNIGSGIINIYSRTPSAIGQTAAGLDAVSNGRAILGIGASGPQVIEGFHGVPYDRPLARTREIIEICRMMWRREKVEHTGIYNLPLPEGQGTGLGKALKLINHPVREHIPIYVAAIGQKNVAMTAEIADGWLPIFFMPEKAKDVWGDALAAGAAKRDPSLPPLDVVAGGLFAIGDGMEGVREFMRPQLALYIGGMGARGKNFYNQLACDYGFEKEAKLVQDLYLDGKKQEAAAEIPAEMLESMTLVGPEGYVKEKIAAFREAGVTNLQVTAVSQDPIADLEKLKAWAD